MKSLVDYTNEPITAALNKHGAFFAFSNEQFEEAKVDGVRYTSLGAGLVVPVGKGQAVVSAIEDATSAGIAQDIAENGMDAIIKRELYNHECFYTGDLTPCIDALDGYLFQKTSVVRVYREEYPNSDL